VCSARRMINYTERLTLLMQDVVSRVPALSFIEWRRARLRAIRTSNAEVRSRRAIVSAFRELPLGITSGATVDARADPPIGVVRHEIPVVTVRHARRQVHRSRRAARFSTSRSINRGRKSFYPGADPWIAKLDTSCTSSFTSIRTRGHPAHRA